MKAIALLLLCSIAVYNSNAQSCSPQGNPAVYGTNNVWRGYVYNKMDLTGYRGYVTEGNSSSPNFDEDFGGSNTSYSTNGCPVQTETFSVRYRLTKTFTNATYDFTVGGDDGYRLSLDGGNTWVINQWQDQGYNTTTYSVVLNGTYNMVLDFYENSGANRISFNVTTVCTGPENQNTYGTNNIWNGYIYSGTNFNTYKGRINRGSSTDFSFDENFGGDNVTFNTSTCGLITENFSARFKLTKTFPNGSYTFLVGGDDGYRFSLDGGNTWVINRWLDQSYTTTNYTVTLNGTYNLVLEYYEAGGANRISISTLTPVPLAVNLLSFTGSVVNNASQLKWKITADSDPLYFDVEKSIDGSNFNLITKVYPATSNGTITTSYQYTDRNLQNGNQYYRLKMTDVHGQVTYSNIVNLSGNGINPSISLLPNPSTGSHLLLQSNTDLSKISVTITDASGRIIIQKEQEKLFASQSMNLLTGKNPLSKGIYFMRVLSNNSLVLSRQLVIQ